jgi:peptidoglycan/LPS O-acetylase OafA/YrhL
VYADSARDIRRFFYRPELDALRFFAFFSVFIFHVIPHSPTFYLKHHLFTSLAGPICAVAGAGAYGVDLFFALSAYLITNLLLQEKKVAERLNVRSFYLRRILRIWPLYFVFVGVAAIIPFWDRFQRLDWPYIAGYLLLAGNWVCAVKGLPSSVAIPLWSVSVEEQFYLIWPLAVGRMGRRKICLLAIVLLIAGTVIRAVLIVLHAGRQAVEYNTIARIDAIALGILLACVLGTRAPILSAITRFCMFASGATIWIMVARFCDLNASTGSAPIIGTLLGRPFVAIGAVIMLLSFIGAPNSGYRFLTNGCLIYLGKISYGLYVFHILGLYIAGYIFPTNSLKGYSEYLAMGFALTLVLSMLSYRWLETPFLRLKERFSTIQSRPV